MYLHWWFLIRLIDVIDVLKLVVPDMADWCCETGGFWYDPLTYIYPQIVGMVYPISALKYRSVDARFVWWQQLGTTCGFHSAQQCLPHNFASCKSTQIAVKVWTRRRHKEIPKTHLHCGVSSEFVFLWRWQRYSRAGGEANVDRLDQSQAVLSVAANPRLAEESETTSHVVVGATRGKRKWEFSDFIVQWQPQQDMVIQ